MGLPNPMAPLRNFHAGDHFTFFFRPPAGIYASTAVICLSPWPFLRTVDDAFFWLLGFAAGGSRARLYRPDVSRWPGGGSRQSLRLDLAGNHGGARGSGGL